MASKRNKKRVPKQRNHHAIGAALRSGSGKHQDRRTRRARTRAAQKRSALAEY